jgi:NAD-dependent DNA ligase
MAFYLTSKQSCRALELALISTPVDQIPEIYNCFRKGLKAPYGRTEENQRFVHTLHTWEHTIQEIFDSPFNPSILERVLFCIYDPREKINCLEDFRDWKYFLEYVDYKKSQEDCPEFELRNLNVILNEYSAFAEDRLEKPKLKSDLAQELMETGEINLFGHQIKFWQPLTQNTSVTQQDWVHLGSLARLNDKEFEKLGCVVFTGVFQVGRKELTDYASDLGFEVQAKVNSKTNLVIYGNDKVGPEKIASFLKQRELRQDIQLMHEKEFLLMALESMAE